ncbi:MetQ/NlpA family ABC transporter substrate-binding protein [Kroppenstedtia eburnea]|uniref:Lipoprotein n=1 Tax=Kroppenstedtia eburnea TaxID=714067 RepID=A0A1N7JQD6_9BACL|nr:MetQ/NlpA family ABC transporter substrate-binding protein [Kroppenstedtia eburnea]EGK10682.1 methionine ABC superfamily ATP binding cassette transporter, binding protein [Desmospora sp. 8437]QKI83472.1 ABC transporter substrate-binding protein [Kroppenstedtia eburnea]SIS51559.1 D-methionine transport system substrate-binding protein [Kroppenstedtia eburnea]
MRKRWSLVLLAFSLALALTACGGQEAGGADGKQVLKVGASQVPHAEILNQVKPDLEKKGIQLEVKVLQDYVTPNKGVEEGQLDANFFQHLPWMETSNKERGWHLKKVVGVHIEPIGVYSEKIDKITQLKEGSTIALPNGTSEVTRVLLLLEHEGLIGLKKGDGEKSIKDITDNPKKLKFKPLEAATLPRVLDQVDLAAINTNYALQAKLNPLKDALIIEGKDSPYVNVLAVKEGKEKDKAVQELAKALTSPKVAQFIEKKYKGAVVPAF